MVASDVLAHRRRRHRAHIFCQGLTRLYNYQLSQGNGHRRYPFINQLELVEQDPAYGGAVEKADRKRYPLEGYSSAGVKEVQPADSHDDIVLAVQRGLREVLEQLARERAVA